jgi:hypothetical protein
MTSNMRARRDSAIAPEKMEGNSAFQTNPKVQARYANSRLVGWIQWVDATPARSPVLIYVRHWLEADGQAQALRLKYVPVVSQVLPGRKAATFFQLDRRLNMIIDLQLFSQIPLAHVKEQAGSDIGHP